MRLKQIIEELELKPVYLSDPEVEVKGGYAGDLLSNVMAGAKEGDIWITIQGHQNIVAIALLVDVAAVIIAQDMEIEEKALKRAEEKGINLLQSPLYTYEIAGQLYSLGIGENN
ncbi:MAG: DRTGG domain-containing protein [Bacillota bacterium]